MDRAKCPPDTTSFNTIMNAYLKLSRWTDAERVPQLMESRGVEWVVKTFNIWINAHMRKEGGSVEEAERLFRAMQGAPYYFRPSSSTYDARLYFHMFRKDWRAAEELIRKVHPLKAVGGSGGNCDTVALLKSYRILINGFCESGKLDKANEYYRELMDKQQDLGVGSSPQENANLSSIRVSLMKVAAKQKNLKYCKSIYSECVQGTGGIVSDSLNAAMINAYSACGDIGGAIEWTDSVIPGAGQGTATLAKIRGWGGGGVVRDSVSGNLTLNNDYSGAIPFGRGSSYALMRAYAKAGEFDRMQAVYLQMLRLESWGFSNSKSRSMDQGAEGDRFLAALWALMKSRFPHFEKSVREVVQDQKKPLVLPK
ncbi:UNVERIFIED_CONTAM: hypothetical protein HDU68_010894 [Siphonaria sp. JEL0065]|nr:hypothetical protein HDU68_010894 [Siphonaria sp. JEL0065]